MGLGSSADGGTTGGQSNQGNNSSQGGGGNGQTGGGGSGDREEQYNYATARATPAPPSAPTYTSANPNIKSLTMGGAPPSGYQTQAPNYTDLKAKHTAGYQDPASKTRTMPQAFNFNGTVYQYEPDTDGYRDMYTGKLIGPDSNFTGSMGIAGLYGNEQINGQQYVPGQAPEGSAGAGPGGGGAGGPPSPTETMSATTAGILARVRDLLRNNRTGGLKIDPSTQGIGGLGQNQV